MADSSPRFGIQVLDLTRNPTQRAAFLDPTPYICYSGGIGSGKTSILCLKGLYLSAMIPNNLGVVYRRTFPDLRISTRETFCNLVPEGLVKQWKEAENRLILTNGSEIFFKHFADGITLGPNMGWWLVDQAEDLTEEDFDYLIGRTRRNVPRRYGMLAMNPNGKDWQFRRFVESKNPRFKMYNSTTMENAANLPPGYIDDLKENYKGEMWDRFVEGSWATMSGLILHEFDENRDVVDPFPVPSDWVKGRGNDWGVDAPATCVWIAADKADPPTFYVVDGYGAAEKTAEEHAKNIVERTKQHGVMRATVLDASAFSRGSELKSVADKYRAAGLPCQPATRDFAASILTVKNLLKTGKLKFFRDVEGLKPLFTEMKSWKWSRSHVHKEKPASGNDHYIDALRYVLDFFHRRTLYSEGPTKLPSKIDRPMRGTLVAGGAGQGEGLDEVTGLPNG